MKNDCIFCAIAANEIPSYKVYEDADILAFLDIGPLNEGHMVIVPKAHAENVYELPDELAVQILPLAKRLANKMRETLHCDGLNLIQNNGRAAGQSVDHFHLHLIPRFEGAIAIRWGAGLDPKPTPEAFEAIRTKLCPDKI